MNEIKSLIDRVVIFRDARDWKQFHNPKDMALSLVLEAGEVMELFQWKNTEKAEQYVAEHKNEIGDELSDVLYWILLMSHDFNINILNAFEKKMKEDEDKYPIEKAKGNSAKYINL